MTHAFVAVTDFDWFTRLSAERPDEVNFWQPSGSTNFRALEVGGIFLFKLYSPRDFIVGGGVFAHFSLLPVSLAWDAFGTGNGVASHDELRRRIARYRHEDDDRRADPTIGCIVLTQPFFLPESEWIPAPADWSRNIVSGNSYDLTTPVGFALLERVRQALSRSTADAALSQDLAAKEGPRFGKPGMVRPRLGQGAFRVVVTDAYARRCSVTGERVLPVLEAAHIRPYAQDGRHELANGILLRSDLHKLFDQGYMTVTPDLRLAVSRRIREDFENGRDYYALQEKDLRAPAMVGGRPAEANLVWHNENRYLG